MSSELQPEDPAVSRRLRRLAGTPVDTTALDRALLSAIPRPATRVADRSAAQSAPRSAVWFSRSRALIATAASVSVVSAVILVLALASRPALAEPGSMADLHRDLVSGRLPMTRVSSIGQANALLSSSWPDAPEVPSLPALPEDLDLACCLRDVKGRRVVCVVLDDNGTPISIIVAPKSDLRPTPNPNSPPCQTMTHNRGDINMLMKERDGVFICIMGRVSPDRLQAIADSMRY